MTEWIGCYDDSWKDEIVDEAFSHPAKMARGLVRRIFDYLIDVHGLSKGSVIVDPFGGVGTTGIEGASRGMRCFACELEPRFVELAKQNIELHRRTWEHFGDPIPVIVQGDSRRLCEVLGPVMADCVISSPPYSDQNVTSGNAGNAMMKSSWGTGTDLAKGRRDYGQSPGQLGAMKPGTVDAVVNKSLTITTTTNTMSSKGDSDDGIQSRTKTIGGEKTRGIYEDVGAATERIDVALYSSGYVARADSDVLRDAFSHDSKSDEIPCDSSHVEGEEKRKCASQLQGRQERETIPDCDNEGQMPEVRDDKDAGHSSQERRPLRQPAGESGSALQQLPHERDEAEVVGGEEGREATAEKQWPRGLEVACIVSSPPYEGSQLQQSEDYWQKKIEKRPDLAYALRRHEGNKTIGSNAKGAVTSYGNIGATEGDTFWSAAREIVAQFHQILKPGGIAVWVCKDFVRNKARVPFSADWVRLCESQGFRLVEWIHASLVKTSEAQLDLFGGEHYVKVTKKASFFRRLAEAKGSPKIDWEDVLVVEKRDDA